MQYSVYQLHDIVYNVVMKTGGAAKFAPLPLLVRASALRSCTQGPSCISTDKL